MFGRREEAICPYCKHKYIESFGCATHAYRVNGSEHSYIECSCPACKKPFWYSFVTDSMEKQDTDEIVLKSITCY